MTPSEQAAQLEFLKDLQVWMPWITAAITFLALLSSTASWYVGKCKRDLEKIVDARKAEANKAEKERTDAAIRSADERAQRAEEVLKRFPLPIQVTLQQAESLHSLLTDAPPETFCVEKLTADSNRAGFAEWLELSLSAAGWKNTVRSEGRNIPRARGVRVTAPESSDGAKRLHQWLSEVVGNATLAVSAPKPAEPEPRPDRPERPQFSVRISVGDP